MRAWFEATKEEGVQVAAHTYEQVVENTKQTFLKLVSKDRAIINLLRLEPGNKSFMDFLADVEDQTHLCPNWESLTGEDMKRISLLGGLKDKTLAEKALAEEYTLKEQCPRCTYEKQEAGQRCLAEERKCNRCGDRGHFGMLKMCKKKKTARRVNEELEETTSDGSDSEEEKEVNRVVRDQVWPRMSGKAKRRSVATSQLRAGRR